MYSLIMDGFPVDQEYYGVQWILVNAAQTLSIKCQSVSGIIL